MKKEPANNIDPCSLSNLDSFLCSHLNWKINVDFKERKLCCVAELQFSRKAGTNSTNLILDTSFLVIHSVQCCGNDVPFTVGDPVGPYGQPLNIQLQDNCLKGDKICIIIDYTTTDKCTAVQWLTAQQTAGKKFPYLFTQCQAIHARSIVPCQDSPSSKMTYTAEVTTVSDVTSLMSAIKLDDQTLQDGKRICKFKQEIPIPSYLLALAVGALESRDVGPRSKVWCEKEFVDAAAYEFGEVESMIAAAESLLGPYVWKQYDLLILPPSFPYGGMENPCLTFVTPTTLAGDRSLTSLAIHEISHSWTGNLVTNCSWEHFWLNEGFTRFVEAKIIGILHGEPSRQFAAIGGWQHLVDAVQTFGTNNPLTSLVPNLKDVDPDDAFSSIPYEKGYAFLAYLENILGGADVFNPFLLAYIENFKHQSISTDDFKTFLYSYFKNSLSLNEVDWNAWLNTSGMPPIHVIDTYDKSMVKLCDELVLKWTTGTEERDANHCKTLFKELKPGQVIQFLNDLMNKGPHSVELLDEINKLYELDSSRNCEIKFVWLQMCLKSDRKCVYPVVAQFLTDQGRMKFVRPLYRSFYANSNTRDLCLDLFKKQRDSYHSICANLVAKDLELA